MRITRLGDVKCFFPRIIAARCSLGKLKFLQWTGCLSLEGAFLVNFCFSSPKSPESTTAMSFKMLRVGDVNCLMPACLWNTSVELETNVANVHLCTHPCHTCASTRVHWVDSHLFLSPALGCGPWHAVRIPLRWTFFLVPLKTIYSKPPCSADSRSASMPLLVLRRSSWTHTFSFSSCCFEAPPPPRSLLLLITRMVMWALSFTPVGAWPNWKLIFISLILPHWTSPDFINSCHQLEKWGVSRMPFSKNSGFVQIGPLKQGH